MNLFLSYKNNTLSVSSHRPACAQVTTVEDIYAAVQEGRNERLVASFKQDFEYDADTKIATFSGICYNGDDGFEVRVNQEAHNVNSDEEGRGVWGLDSRLRPSI